MPSTIRDLPTPQQPSKIRGPADQAAPAPRPQATHQARPASAPHTNLPPTRCPYCRSRALSRKGIRRKKFETVQLWRCAKCKRVFTPSPAPLRGKTYPLSTILEGITLYDLGYPLPEVVAKLKSRYGHTVAPSSLSAWIAEHKELTTYRRLRAQGRRLFPPAQTIRAVKLYHRQVYRYAFHRPKLAMLRQSRQYARFAPLSDFLETVPTRCPHVLFRDSSRASQIRSDFIDPSRLLVSEKENFATRTAALVLPSLGDNYLRHETLQRFMLANDSVTLAVEVPIWLTPDDIAALELEHGIRLHDEKTPSPTITGHIDFLQVRNGAVHILDYKPDAPTNRPIAQLTIYALALSKLTGIRLFDIKCGWFNEEQYCEFFPRVLLARSDANHLSTEHPL